MEGHRVPHELLKDRAGFRLPRAPPGVVGAGPGVCNARGKKAGPLGAAWPQPVLPAAPAGPLAAQEAGAVPESPPARGSGHRSSPPLEGSAAPPGLPASRGPCGTRPRPPGISGLRFRSSSPAGWQGPLHRVRPDLWPQSFAKKVRAVLGGRALLL